MNIVAFKFSGKFGRESNFKLVETTAVVVLVFLDSCNFKKGSGTAGTAFSRKDGLIVMGSKSKIFAVEGSVMGTVT